ncbi:hypothetical protein GF402_09095, partial [Candidatus Fermentibacteria bacterium]|nr:hypothetical protein [Candidatus Fermentibacteria bacterium]
MAWILTNPRQPMQTVFIAIGGNVSLPERRPRCILRPPHGRQIAFLLLLIVLAVPASTFSDEPPENTIPTLIMRLVTVDMRPWDITVDLLCEMSWLHFDAINFHGWGGNQMARDVMARCEEVGLCYSFCAFEIMQYLKEWANPDHRYWFRNYGPEPADSASLLSDSCFAQSSTDFDSIINYTSADSMYEVDKDISLTEQIVNGLATEMADMVEEGISPPWFYEVYDEAPSQQWRHVTDDELPYNDYIPNVYTQAVDGSGEPTQEEVEASGIYSWQKYLAENNPEFTAPFVMNFAMHHQIDQDDYTGLIGDRDYGDFHDQANSVRAVIKARFQPPPEGGVIPDTTLDNSPELICLDYYPFRYVNPDSAEKYSIDVEMCDDDWLFLIDHFEEGIDSTVIPASELDTEVFFYPQVFGAAGGPMMYNPEGDHISPESYLWRKPAPQELRMLCNLALLHQAKGILPYNLISYIERPNDLNGSCNKIVSSLLDRHGIPFDAPYEDWRYTGRWPGEDESDYDYSYIPPDSIPPWIDGFDPLYEVPDRPIMVPNDPRNPQRYYEWLFEPYGI